MNSPPHSSTTAPQLLSAWAAISASASSCTQQAGLNYYQDFDIAEHQETCQVAGDSYEPSYRSGEEELKENYFMFEFPNSSIAAPTNFPHPSTIMQPAHSPVSFDVASAYSLDVSSSMNMHTSGVAFTQEETLSGPYDGATDYDFHLSHHLEVAPTASDSQGAQVSYMQLNTGGAFPGYTSNYGASSPSSNAQHSPFNASSYLSYPQSAPTPELVVRDTSVDLDDYGLVFPEPSLAVSSWQQICPPAFAPDARYINPYALTTHDPSLAPTSTFLSAGPTECISPALLHEPTHADVDVSSGVSEVSRPLKKRRGVSDVPRPRKQRRGVFDASRPRKPRRPSPPSTTTPAPEAPNNNNTLISYKPRNVQISSSEAAAPSVAAPKDRWTCRHCGFVQHNHRAPDLRRHIFSHKPRKWVCCGVPLADARALGVPENVAQGAVLEFEGMRMVGGCRHTFKRPDAYARHLRTFKGRCWGDWRAPYQPGNRAGE